MSKRSKKGKFRPNGTASKVKFDILPPQGDPEVSVAGYAAIFVAALIGAVILSQTAALAALAWPLAVGAIVVLLLTMVLKGFRRGR